ncbi:MAG: glycosyltransferase [Bacteroidales bacterium]
MKSKPLVLVSPLNWGLGHSSRCTPLINKLLENDFDIILGSDGQALSFLMKEFPQLKYIELPGLQIKYPKKGNLVLNLLTQLPSNIQKLKSENKRTNEAIQKYNIKGIISDNRFGVYNKDVYSIFMTHQIQILTPSHTKLSEKIVFKLNHRLLEPFDEVWIPDYKDEPSLSGKLSHGIKLPDNTHYIGPLSRFSQNYSLDKNTSTPKVNILAIISGPEYQRTLFEEQIYSQLKELNVDSIIIQGKPSENKCYKDDKIQIYSHLESNQLKKLIKNTPIIISRSGYSSIMDFVVLDKKAILIPTPGQTEQEYLSEEFERKNIFPSFSQNNFNLKTAISKLDNYSGIKYQKTNKVLETRIQNFKKTLT